MRWAVGIMVVIGLMLTVGIVEAKDRPIEQLPQDMWNLAFVWTEPIKAVAKRTRQFDPLSGFWFGLVDGSVKSVERTAAYLIPHEDDSTGPSPTFKSGKALLRYTF